MRRLLLIATALYMLTSCGVEKTRKAVFIIVDGVPTDMVERLDLPNIEEIASIGAYGHSYVGGGIGMYDQTPTISAVGYTDLLTATWANKHNVWGNSNLNPNYNYWTIFRIAESQDKDVKTAIFSSWTDNRTVLLGEGKAQTDNLKIDYVFDGYELDTLNFPEKDFDLHIFDIDERVSKEAAKCISEDAPDMSWVYLWYPDDAGHNFGNGKTFDDFVVLADKQIGRVWEAVKYRQGNFNEDWMIVVTTDHGRKFDGYGHGGQQERERSTWVATNQKANKRLKSGKSAITDIAPSICRFMGFEIPVDVIREQDGISFYGKADIMEMRLAPYDNNVTLSWVCLDKNAEVKVWAATTDNFKQGGKEDWIYINTVPAKDESYSLDLETLPQSDFYKFVLETPNAVLNRQYNDVPEKYLDFKLVVQK